MEKSKVVVNRGIFVSELRDLVSFLDSGCLLFGRVSLIVYQGTIMGNINMLTLHARNS